jgi:hypothetical protein
MSILIVAEDQALIERIVPLIRAEGLAVEATTRDDQAVGALEAGSVSVLVIAAELKEHSRSQLRVTAERHSISVVERAARGDDPEAYVREELVPALRAVLDFEGFFASRVKAAEAYASGDFAPLSKLVAHEGNARLTAAAAVRGSALPTFPGAARLRS